MSERHWIWLDRSPFSASSARPVKVTGSPGWALVPLAGAVIVMAGVWFCASVRTSAGWPLVASRLL